MADVEAVDGRYVMAGAIMVTAPIEVVRAVVADDARLVDWVPHASAVPGPVGDGEVRMGVGATHGPAPYAGRTTVEADGAVVRRWVLLTPGPAAGWERHIRWTLTRVQGGTLVDAEVTTSIPGGRARALRAGAKAERKGLEGALDRLARMIEGRHPPRRTAPQAGPL